MNCPFRAIRSNYWESHEVLEGLAAEEPLCAQVVKLHCFLGMTHSEAAEALNLSEKTVKRYWAYSIAWLQRALEK